MFTSQKRTKKRSALYQAGPKAKKPHLETSTEKTGKDGGQKLGHKSPKEKESRPGREGAYKPETKENMKKRRRPVTKTTEDSEEESDQGKDEDDEADDEDFIEEGDSMIVDQKINGSSTFLPLYVYSIQNFKRRQQPPMNHAKPKKLSSSRDALKSLTRTFFHKQNKPGLSSAKSRFLLPNVKHASKPSPPFSFQTSPAMNLITKRKEPIPVI